MKIKMTIFLLVFTVICSCSKSTDRVKDAPAGNLTDDERKVEQEFQSRNGEVQEFWPHKAAFLKNGHGEYFYKGKVLCQACHGIDLKGGRSHSGNKETSSCYKCHDFPHEFVGKKDELFQHTLGFFKDRKITDVAYVGCKDCHIKSLERIKAKKIPIKSCSECHKYPHIKKEGDRFFKHKRADISFGRDNPDYVGCTTCHEKNFDRIKQEIPKIRKCKDCHNFPHNKSANDKVFDHGKMYLEDKGISKKDYANCSSCHKEMTSVKGEKSIEGIKGCTECHNFPHVKKTIDKVWKHKDAYHKEKSVSASDFVKCIDCHNEDGKDTKKSAIFQNKKKCLECHNYPHIKGSGEEKFEGHGKKFVKEEMKEKKSLGKDYLTCFDCHKKDKVDKIVVNAPKKCKECHKVDMPHDEKFIDSQHHKSHAKLATKHLGKCKTCHLEKDIHGDHSMKKFNRLIPEHLAAKRSSEKCKDCHNDKLEIAKGAKLASKKKGYLKLLKDHKEMVKQMVKRRECKVCHVKKGTKSKLNLDKKHLSSCAACHKGYMVPSRMFKMERGRGVETIKWKRESDSDAH